MPAHSLYVDAGDDTGLGRVWVKCHAGDLVAGPFHTITVDELVALAAQHARDVTRVAVAGDEAPIVEAGSEPHVAPFLPPAIVADVTYYAADGSVIFHQPGAPSPLDPAGAARTPGAEATRHA